MLGLSTAVHPVAAAQHYQPAQAVPPAIQAFDCFHTTNAGPTQQLLEDRHAGVYPGPEGVHHRDGGCKDASPTEYIRGVNAVLPGPSKRLPAILNPSSA